VTVWKVDTERAVRQLRMWGWILDRTKVTRSRISGESLRGGEPQLKMARMKIRRYIDNLNGNQAPSLSLDWPRGTGKISCFEAAKR
jgi:hypothetical protein